MTPKEILATKIASIRKGAERSTKQANDLQAFHDSIPDLLTPEAKTGLMFILARLVSVFVLLAMLCCGVARAEDSPATTTPATLVTPTNTVPNAAWYTVDYRTNAIVWKWYNPNLVEEWLIVKSDTTNSVSMNSTNTTILTKREPVVVKGTNGWTITFPEVVAPAERGMSTGDATTAAGNMFKQGAMFGAMVKQRNQDMENVSQIIEIAEKLFRAQMQK